MQVTIILFHNSEMNKLSDEKRAMILKALVEGNSMRATARLTGTSKNTVSRLLKNVGTYCMDQHDALVRGVESERVQCDEIWSFCGAKERNVPKDEKHQGRGDVWTWTALCQDSKLMIAYRVGCRGAMTGVPFMQDLADRLRNRVHLSTDGHGVYPRAVERAFGWGGADYGRMVKIYGQSSEGQRRYSPPVCLGAEKSRVMGNPVMEDTCTSHVERSNLTLRMHSRRFTRLTNAFSKKIAFHEYAVALHFMYYNFCKPHTTLTKERKGIKTTPAKAAGLTDRVWKIEELLPPDFV